MQLPKKHEEFFNNNTGKNRSKIFHKHRQSANKNRRLRRQPIGKTSRQGKFFIRPPYFRRLNEYNCSNQITRHV